MFDVLVLGVVVLGTSDVMADAPQIKPTVSLQHKAITLGKSTSFQVTATGTGPLVYQWYSDGRLLPGRTSDTLQIGSTQPADEGDYTVVVHNSQGSTTNPPARLWVVPPSSALRRAIYTNSTGARLSYSYLTPTNYTSARAYPLVCFYVGLPDSYGYEDEFKALADGWFGFYKLFASYRQQVANPAVVAWFYRRNGQKSWDSQYVAQVGELAEHLVTEFSIDTNRVYAVGGGEVVPVIIDTIRQRPNLFTGAIFYLPFATSNGAVDAIKHLPIWDLHSAADGYAEVRNSRQLVHALREAGAHPIYTEITTAPHPDDLFTFMCIPAMVDWLLKQDRIRSVAEPLLSITNPTRDGTYVTSAAAVSLGGLAQAMGESVTGVSWENVTTRTQGSALGGNSWTCPEIPLARNQTNTVIVTATTTSWAPAYGGNTTFSQTLFVVSEELRATLTSTPAGAILDWTGGTAPFRVQMTSTLPAAQWTDVCTNAVPPLQMRLDRSLGFFRVVGP